MCDEDEDYEDEDYDDGLGEFDTDVTSYYHFLANNGL